MPKYTRIYTRTGDEGSTGLAGGGRIAKNHPRIECYGTVDELSSAIGVARSALAFYVNEHPRAGELDRWLAWIQDVLFNLGAELATLPANRWEGMPLTDDADVKALEEAIDVAQAQTAPLNQFIHPGGSPPGAHLHFARTICRRAERAVVDFAQTEEVSESALKFLNRLSDALFAWARWINDALAVPEHTWNAKTSPPSQH